MEAVKMFVVGAVGVACVWLFKESCDRGMAWYWLLCEMFLSLCAMALTARAGGDKATAK